MLIYKCLESWKTSLFPVFKFFYGHKITEKIISYQVGKENLSREDMCTDDAIIKVVLKVCKKL